MPVKKVGGQAVDAYIKGLGPKARRAIQQIRKLVRELAPKATETLGYGVPTFKMKGNLIHYAAFMEHFGLYPPVRDDAKLVEDLKPYAGPKGNLKFPLDEKLPISLIKRVIKYHIKREAEASGGE